MQKKHPNNEQFLHDACLFSLPTIEAATWKNLATQNNARLLLNSNLKQILSITKEIESQLKQDKSEIDSLIKTLTLKYKQEELKEVEKLISNKIIELNKFCSHYETQAERKTDDTIKYKKALVERD